MARIAEDTDEQVRRIVGFIPQDPHVVMNEVFIIGFSLGAAIAIGAASADTDHYIRGIVVDTIPYNIASKSLNGSTRLRNCG